MTGAGLARGACELGEVVVEIRSVNGRGLTVKSRLPSEAQPFESFLDARVRARLQRGSVVVAVDVGAAPADVATPIDDDAFARTATRLTELARENGLDAPRVGDVLSVPGVVGAGQRTRTSREPSAAFVALVDAALDGLVEHRRTEGARTVEELRSALAELAELRATVLADAPRVVAEYRERLLARVNETLDARGAAIGDDEVVREVTLFADKVNVDEELQRLASHLDAVGTTLDAGGAVGRRLDFLLQEVLREVNTLGSKSPDVAVAHAVVAMKGCVDTLKEQAANLE